MHRALRSCLPFVLCLAALTSTRSHAAPPTAPLPGSCTDSSGVCVDGASFKAGSGLTDAARKKEAKRYRKKKDLDLSIVLTEGRASVFVDGVWVGLAPQTGLKIKPGKHDIELRDGETIFATGTLQISAKAKGAVNVTVVGRATN